MPATVSLVSEKSTTEVLTSRVRAVEASLLHLTRITFQPSQLWVYGEDQALKEKKISHWHAD